MTFEEARAQFPVLERRAYLNAGTFGPLPRAALEAMAERQRAELEEGRGGPAYFQELRALRERVRAQLASLLGVDPEHVALASSTTNACNIVVAGLDLAPGDEIVTTDAEHFGLIGPLHASGARVRVARVRDRSPEDALEAILGQVGARTRLVALSHVSWLTGNVLPVEELREACDVPVLVDGAQAVGAIPVEAAAYDFYTVSGQKWLCGPDATGALFVRDPERLRVATPSYFGQDGFEEDGAFTPRAGAPRFDAGAIPVSSLAALEASIEAAPHWAFRHAAEVGARCWALLGERFEVVTAPGQATLVSFRPGGDPAETVARLQGRGVVVRDLPRTGWIRVSCGWWTSDGDLERLLDGLIA